MFKFNLSSIFGSSKKSTPISSDSVPKAFVMKADNETKLLNISMENTIDEEFVNIKMNELSYAEAATLASKKPSIPVTTVTPKVKMVKKSSKSRESMEEDLEDSIHEKYKSNLHYAKHRAYKKADKKKRNNKGKKRH